MSSVLFQQLLMRRLMKHFGMDTFDGGVNFLRDLGRRQLKSITSEEYDQILERVGGSPGAEGLITFVRNLAQETPELTIAQMLQLPSTRALLGALIEQGSGQFNLPLASVLEDPEGALATLLADAMQ